MELKKHDDEMAKRVEFLDYPSDRQLARELMELHETKCRACQEDRLSCTVRPACKNRNFLNTLIELGVETQDLPEFCYSVYMDQLRRYILEGKGRGMNDRRLPIKDLMATLKVSSIRHFNTKFKTEWKNYVAVNSKDQMIVAGDKLVFHFDFTRGIVIINPENEQLTRFDLVHQYAEVYSQFMNVPVEVKTITSNWWEIRFSIKGNPESDKIKELLDSIPSTIANHEFVASKGSSELILEIISDSKNNPLLVSELQELFNSVKRISS
ncbi:MAG: hypothetical protein ACFFED_01400 [Candidatus Thorarchaeota archaeon]